MKKKQYWLKTNSKMKRVKEFPKNLHWLISLVNFKAKSKTSIEAKHQNSANLRALKMSIESGCKRIIEPKLSKATRLLKSRPDNTMNFPRNMSMRQKTWEKLWPLKDKLERQFKTSLTRKWTSGKSSKEKWTVTLIFWNLKDSKEVLSSKNNWKKRSTL